MGSGESVSTPIVFIFLLFRSDGFEGLSPFVPVFPAVASSVPVHGSRSIVFAVVPCSYYLHLTETLTSEFKFQWHYWNPNSDVVHVYEII